MSNFTENSDEVRLYLERSGILSVQMPPLADWLERIRKVPGRRWDKWSKRWVVPGEAESVAAFCYYFQDVPVLLMNPELFARYEGLRKLRSLYEHNSLRKLSEKLKAKGYSTRTLKAYIGHAERFLEQLKVPLAEAEPEHVHAYTLGLLEEKRSHSYVNQVISALRFWLAEVEGRSVFAKNWTRPKREKKLPSVLSQEEVVQILRATRALKHRALLTLVYSAGLRVGEVVRLKRKDVDPARKVIHIRRQERPLHRAVRCGLYTAGAVHPGRAAVRLPVSRRRWKGQAAD